MPGVGEMLRRLATSYRIGVVSNTHDRTMVPELLEASGLAETIEATVLSVDHGYCKPHPSIYRAAVDRVRATPSEVAFVGDSYEADFVGPQDAGMRGHLIDPDAGHSIPSDRRLRSILDIEALLNATNGG